MKTKEKNADIAINVTDLEKHFKFRGGILKAVDQVTLQVLPGEIFGVIGPDGAGKTTLSRVILGLLTRTNGKSEILGYDSMDDTYAIREQVGYIAQMFALPADLTVIENLRFFARIHGVSSADQKRRIPELLGLAGLGDFTNRLAGKLSGGMKKKLALACSLIHEPLVLILDEPTLGVDPVSRREFWNLLGNLRVDKGLTVFVCTPYMDEAERCHRVGLMYAGRLMACATPAEIKAMIPGRLLEFTPIPFEPAKQLVIGLEGVLEVQTYGKMLHVFVDNLNLRQPEIESAFVAHQIHWSDMRDIEPRMEEAYISLVSRRLANNSGGKVWI